MRWYTCNCLVVQARYYADLLPMASSQQRLAEATTTSTLWGVR